ncbi:MAG: transaldolase [Planctomycetaceae bacterium]|nr:transaldolase [Planctomycetaceae bacterium]
MAITNNPLPRVSALGQSLWLDYIRRDLMSSGGLRRLIEDDGLRGMTSNPAIFEKAISGSQDYAADIQSGMREGKSVETIYEALSQRDVQTAADIFRPVYDKLNGADGYVSLEVNPHLAHETQGTIEEGRRLWAALDRPNVFIKVPATKAGLPAIKQLISEGINVNVTLLFGLPRYREVVEAYIGGLEARVAAGQPVDRIASVASFFLSRIDTLVDPQLEKLVAAGGQKAELAKQALGQVAIASAKVAYEIYKELFGSSRFRRLADKGAKPQRLLWASTGTKNPAYSDVKYIEALIGPATVNTVPVETLDAYRDHGDPQLRLESGTEQAQKVLRSLPELGIKIDQVTQQLEDDGVEKFNKPFDQLMAALTKQTSGK